jgi:hypothetical protein
MKKRSAGILWPMLLEAAHAGDEVDGLDALWQVPELARYVEGWGRPSDLGRVPTAKLDPADGRRDAQLDNGARVHIVHGDVARGGYRTAMEA